jgi:hypothetical protein
MSSRAFLSSNSASLHDGDPIDGVDDELDVGTGSGAAVGGGGVGGGGALSFLEEFKAKEAELRRLDDELNAHRAQVARKTETLIKQQRDRLTEPAADPSATATAVGPAAGAIDDDFADFNTNADDGLAPPTTDAEPVPAPARAAAAAPAKSSAAAKRVGSAGPARGGKARVSTGSAAAGRPDSKAGARPKSSAAAAAPVPAPAPASETGSSAAGAAAGAGGAIGPEEDENLNQVSACMGSPATLYCAVLCCAVADGCVCDVARWRVLGCVVSVAIGVLQGASEHVAGRTDAVGR